MSYIEDINKTLKYIETHLQESITVEVLADAIFMSKYHFARLFKSLVGYTPMAYVRNRRLSLAAIELKDKATPIIEIALNYQFGSQEAFSRAFKSFYDISPYQVRKQNVPLEVFSPIDVVSKEMISRTKERIIEHQIVTLDSMSLIGCQGVILPMEDGKMTTIWKEAMRLLENASGLINEMEHISVLGGGEIDGPYIYFAGFQCDDGISLKDINSSRVIHRFIKQQRYAMFVHEADAHFSKTEGVEETVESIYTFWLPNTEYELDYGDFSLITKTYEKNFRDREAKNKVYIYIPIKN